MALQHFFVGSHYLGSRQIPDLRVIPGLEVRWHHSHALYCIQCGEIWGRLVHDNAPLTQLTHRACRKHGDGRLACHPAWTDLPTRFEDNWPLDAIRYEFDVSLEQALKEVSHD